MHVPRVQRCQCIDCHLSPSQSFGCIYLGAMFLGTQNGFSVQPLVAYERTVFYRERAARTYAVIPYTIAESLVEIPYCALQVR